MRSHPSVRRWLFLAFAAIAIVPTVIVGGLEVRQRGDEEVRDAEREARAIALGFAGEIGALIEGHMHAVDALAALVASHETLEPAVLQPLVDSQRMNFPEFSVMYVGDRAGRSRVVSPIQDDSGRPLAGQDYSDRDYFQAVKSTRRRAVSQVQVGRRTGRPNIQIAAPVLTRDGELFAFAEGSLELAPIRELAKRGVASMDGLQLVLLDSRSQCIADTRHAQALPAHSGEVPPLMRPLTDADVELRFAVDHTGALMRGAAVRVPGPLLGWTVLAFRPESWIRERVSGAMTRAAIVALTALFVALLAAAWLAGRLTQFVGQLAQTASEIGDGDLDATPPPPRRFEPRELVALGDAISRMRSRIREQFEARAAEAEALDRANAELRTLAAALEQSENAVEIVGTDGRYCFVNPAFERLVDRPREALMGRHVDEVAAEVWRDLPEPLQLQEQPVPAASQEVTRDRSDGRSFHLELRLRPIRDAEGRTTHYLRVSFDVTEKRHTAEALRVSERLASLGSLAAGVAHEINNPLTYVLGNVEAAQASLDGLEIDDVALRESLDDALEGALRVHRIVSDLRTLSHSGPDDVLEAVDLHEVLEATVRLARPETRPRASISVDLPALPRVSADRGRLGQVFLNLLVNAGHAIEPGDPGRNRIEISGGVTAGGQVEINVRDTGSGMSEEVLSRIFDPFFTTKRVGEGTGLGLSICHRIVRDMGGELSARSREGAGSVFTVRLQPAAELRGDFEAPPPPSRPGTIPVVPIWRVLLIDDELPIAKLLSRWLRPHAVTLAHTGGEGLRKALSEDFDVVLCDLMMPELDGMEFYEALRAERPELAERVLFVTGGAVTDRTRRFLEARVDRVLHKPLEKADLLEAIEELVGDDGDGNDASPGEPAQACAS